VTWWGGWGSNPRPVDYENYAPALRPPYLHGYHGAVPPMALVAPFARVVRSYPADEGARRASRAAANQTSLDSPSVVPASSSRFVNSLRRVTVVRLAATGSR
jgi:hypothetical protein